jgi:sulfhydrogenase subunit alpha
VTDNVASGDHVIRTEPLARIEGEGGMRLVVSDGRVVDVELNIFEPPRFFEAMLRGRAWTEPPDITARICGICPVAYQMSSCLAIEDACGVTVTEDIRLMRRLLYCAEWIESHALHIYLLHAPDFLGYDGAVEMAADHRAEVERGLSLKKAGNALMSLIGGRSVHPINVRVGGFYRMPTRAELAVLKPQLLRALDDAVATVAWVGGFEFPDFEQPFEYVALRSPHGYPLEGGSFVTSSGREFDVAEFGDAVREEHVARSTALHAHLEGRTPYVVGPLARYTLNHDSLSDLARQCAREAGLGEVCRNPFRSIIVRAVELVYAIEEALAIIDAWTGTAVPSVPVAPRAGVGYGATEAPRGVLYHRYELAEDGTILDADIVPPTSQNLASMELDLIGFAQDRLSLPVPELTRLCEQAVRNYDPCISCATHFLDLRIDETDERA